MRTKPLIALLLAGAWLAAPVFAQEAGEAPGRENRQDQPPTLAEPPRLLESAKAELPPDTVFPAAQVAVRLQLEIDAQGKVTGARVLEGPGEPFDAAALEAVKKFRFSPARLSDGTTVPVTVDFLMRIERPAPAVQKPPQAPAPAPVEPVKLLGRLLERGTRKPLAGTEILALDESGRELGRAVCDAAGNFSLEVPALAFELRATAPGHEPLAESVEFDKPGESRQVTYYVEEVAGLFETVVRAGQRQEEVGRQIITSEQVALAAGTSGDVLKAVQNLPGAARSSFGAGSLILRGSSPTDSRVFLEGQEIPLLYHFGGLRSTVNSAFLERVEYVPGNFSAAYGRATGGIVEVALRHPAADTFRGNVDLNLYDAGFVLEGPLGGGWSLGGAFHRSWVDTFIGAVIPDDANVSFSTAPRYYDYQLLASYRPERSPHELRLIGYGSLDRVVLLFDRPASDPEIRGSISARIMFHDLMAIHDWRLSPVLQQRLSLVVGYQEFDTEIGPEFFFNLDILRFGFRPSWRWQVLDWLSLRGGLDIQLSRVVLDVLSPLRPIEGEQPPPVSTQNTYRASETQVLYQPALYLEALAEPLDRLSVLAGLRVDYYRDTSRWTVDPRLNLRYRLLADTVVEAGAGYYQQPPLADQTNAKLGNPNLLAPRSSHLSLGVEQGLFGMVSVEFTGFYKWLDRLVTRNPAFFSDPTQPAYLNGGTGIVWGLELLVKVEIPEWFSGWLAYTFQRSRRKDGPGEPERLFDFDQPHNLTMLGTVFLGSGWSAGFRFRLVSGNPYTPVVDSIYYTNSDVFVPVYGETNSARLGTFHQLDLRLDKSWTFERWKLSAYLDVQNVYFRSNPEGVTFSYDYRESTESGGLPILPIIGVKGEW